MSIEHLIKSLEGEGANDSVEKKVSALMGLWVLYKKEFEALHSLIELTASVAQQYVDDVFAEETPKPAKKSTAKPKAKERGK